MRIKLLVISVIAVAAVIATSARYLLPATGSLPTTTAPAEVVWGAPERPLRVVTYNILHNHRGREGVLAEIRRLNPDIVLLQEVEGRDVESMARDLGMIQRNSGWVYFPSQNLAGPRASWGNAVLTRLPIYNAATIPNPGGGSFGIWCDLVDGQRKFRVANVHLSATWKVSLSHFKESANFRNKELTNLKTAWENDGSPPMIIGGDFNNLPLGDNYYLMTTTWKDVLGALNKNDHTFVDGILRTRIDYFLTSTQFNAVDGGVVSSDASDHRPIWMTVSAK